MRLVSRFEELELPEVRVMPALQGCYWIVSDWLDAAPHGLPDGAEVKARLRRSQLCHGTIRTVGALRVLDIPAGARWSAQQDPFDEGFAPGAPASDGRWDMYDPDASS